ncbi:MAG: hypothetical protein ACOYJA_12695 [Christensenellales bacterium]|jgi:DNA-directed RNA polymerase specialized sigma subunit
MEMARLTDQQRQLVADNHNPIYAYLHSKRLPVDDFYDLAAVGLCKAALAYDPARGKFSTLAWQTMSREIGNEFRVRSTARRTAEVISLDAGDIGPKVGLGRGGASFAVRAIRNRLGVLA